MDFIDYSPLTPERWSMTAHGALVDALGEQRGHYLHYDAKPGYPCYRTVDYVFAAVYDREQPGTGTGGHCHYLSSTWSSVAEAKDWMLATMEARAMPPALPQHPASCAPPCSP